MNRQFVIATTKVLRNMSVVTVVTTNRLHPTALRLDISKYYHINMQVLSTFIQAISR